MQNFCLKKKNIVLFYFKKDYNFLRLKKKYDASETKTSAAFNIYSGLRIRHFHNKLRKSRIAAFSEILETKKGFKKKKKGNKTKVFYLKKVRKKSFAVGKKFLGREPGICKLNG